MKDGKMVMLAVGVILMFVGSAMASELTVTKQGSGDGIVFGDGIECGYDCTESYPDETILHLKAMPYPGSEFVDWLVDGKPQEGTLVIRKDITVTAIFEKKSPSLNEFTVVGTRPSDIVYFKDNKTFPLFDTKGQIAGAVQGLRTEEEFRWIVTIWEKANFTIPMIDSAAVPTKGDRIVVYGDYMDGISILPKADLYLYSFDGTLLRSIETHIEEPYTAKFGDTGDFWLAGVHGTTVYSPFVIRRYAPDGELLWEKPLPDKHPRRLVVSPDNTYAALTLQGLAAENVIIQFYEENGSVIYERELSHPFYGVAFVSDQKVMFYSGWRWEMYRLENLETPFVSGELAGVPFGPYPIMIFPPADCFLIKTAVGEQSLKGYHLQAVHRKTGDVLAEHLFEAPPVRELHFYRITEQGSFEVLINGDTIIELTIDQ